MTNFDQNSLIFLPLLRGVSIIHISKKNFSIAFQIAINEQQKTKFSPVCTTFCNSMKCYSPSYVR